MKTIQIRWRTVQKSIKIIVCAYLVVLVLYWFFKPEEPSLKYDQIKEVFLIRQNGSDMRFPFQIKSVNIMYSKILVDDWAYTLERAINLGVNTIQIDIAWNVHEPIHNKFDFTTKSNDLRTFIQLVHNYKLYLIVRIDPYLECSVFDLGGLPSWLLGEDDLKEREEMSSDYESGGGGLLDLNDYKFIDAFQSYLDELVPILAENQRAKNGPIIGLLTQQFYSNNTVFTQISSFYTSDYIDFLKQNLNFNGFFEILLMLQSACDSKNVPQNYQSGDFGKKSKYCDSNLSQYVPVDLRRATHSRTTKSSHASSFDLNCVGNILIFLKY